MAQQQAANTVNIEEIMEEIRADIKKRQLDGTLVPFQDVPQGNVMVNLDVDSDTFDEAKLHKYLDIVNRDYMVILDRPLAVGTSKAGRFVKRAVRRLVRFYINPVVRDQNSVNAAMANSMHQMSNYISHQQAEIRALKREVNALKKETGKTPRKTTRQTGTGSRRSAKQTADR